MIIELPEKIDAIEKMLETPSKLPVQIPYCELVCCEKLREYEQRKHVLNRIIIKLPSPPTRCPGCIDRMMRWRQMHTVIYVGFLPL